MTTVEQILIIILAVGFFVLLVLSIILISLLIAVMRNVKRIAERAEEATGNLSELAAMVGRKVAPFALSGLGAAAMKWVKGRMRK